MYGNGKETHLKTKTKKCTFENKKLQIGKC
jgi:hypothetical protein